MACLRVRGPAPLLFDDFHLLHPWVQYPLLARFDTRKYLPLGAKCKVALGSRLVIGLRSIPTLWSRANGCFPGCAIAWAIASSCCRARKGQREEIASLATLFRPRPTRVTASLTVPSASRLR